MLNRYLDISKHVAKGKVLLIYGPRQVGKTTLVKHFLDEATEKYKYVVGDDLSIQAVMNSRRLSILNEFVEGYELLVIDEAQSIEHIGAALKLIIDANPALKIIATGSSSFHLAQNIGEPLTGRKRTVILFPISQMEQLAHFNQFELKQLLPDFLIYGSYPEVLNAKTKEQKKIVLHELVNSYLLKDILTLANIKGGKQLIDLLKLIAFQIGNEISLNEIASRISVDVKTVARYLDLLEKTFVLFRLGSYSRNLRDEITSKSKYYFFDTGIRNGLISQFNSLENRNDVGQLFENFIVIERTKLNSYLKKFRNQYFWRTYRSGEIDYIEEYNGKLEGYEVKWSPNAKVKKPNKFLDSYEQSAFKIITRENYLEFVS